MNKLPENNLDTGLTLAPKNDKKSEAKMKAAGAAAFVIPSHKTTSENSHTMEPMGFEPTTSCMPCKRSPN